MAMATCWRTVAAVSLGTLFSWYDFFLHGVMAAVLAHHFFGAGDLGVDGPSALFMLSLLNFTAGFVVRPAGALLFGRLGDMIGRKYTFLITLLVMGLSTCAIGLLPTAASVGLAAPVMLVLLRLLQGLALGGEYGGAVVFVAEQAPPGRRGLHTACVQATASLGLAMALAVVLLLRALLGEANFVEWGWRLPFLLSAVLLALGVWVRLSMSESPVYLALRQRGGASRTPIREAFGHREPRRRALLLLFGAVAGQAVVWYACQFHALFYLVEVLQVDEVQAQVMLLLALLLGAPLFPLCGALSDRIGRRPVLLGGLLLAAVGLIPVFDAMVAATVVTPSGSGQIDRLHGVGLLLLLLLPVAMVYAPLAAWLTESFPARIRYTAVSLPYHLGNGWFGGLVPVIAFASLSHGEVARHGLLYPVAVACVSALVCGLWLRDLPAERRRGALG
ncbi:MFS transporter [Sphaerotilus natans]|uniref:MFS transporter n=1 Tax=Sphaerotilus natans TaxID=34103 RepID=UPI00406C7935